MTRSKSSESPFSHAAKEHPKSRVLYAVKGDCELVWWSSSATSLEECSSYSFSGSKVFSVLDHKKFDEVVVCLANGQVLLYNFASKSILSQIGEPKSKLKTVWSGLFSLSKIAHILLVVFDEAQGTHHLRVIRLTSKRVNDKDSSVLEHVCAHLLLQPERGGGGGGGGGGAEVSAAATTQNGSGKKKRGSSKQQQQQQQQQHGSSVKPVVSIATFDVSGLTLSCLWTNGTLASYKFARTKHLASLELSLPPKSASCVMAVRQESVASARLAAFREHHVCVALTNAVAVVNTAFGSAVSSLPLTLEDGENVVSFIAASNDSFFLLATQKRVMRVNVPEPESALLASCLDSAALTERVFGPQIRAEPLQKDVDFVFSVVNGVGTVTAEPVVAIPASAEKLKELMVSKCTPGVGYVLRGASRLKNVVAQGANDVYGLTPEFGASAALDFARRMDWASVVKIVQAQLFSAPPKTLVDLAVSARQTVLLQAIARYCPALSREDVTAILSFAVSSSYEQEMVTTDADAGFANVLLLTVVECQRCPFRLTSLEPADLQSLLRQLYALLTQRGLLSAVSSSDLAPVLDWISCVIDSRPQAFVLDPSMVELISSMSAHVKEELAIAKSLSELGTATEVAKHHLIPAVSAKDQSQLYSIEFLSLAD